MSFKVLIHLCEWHYINGIMVHIFVLELQPFCYTKVSILIKVYTIPPQALNTDQSHFHFHLEELKKTYLSYISLKYIFNDIFSRLPTYRGNTLYQETLIHNKWRMSIHNVKPVRPTSAKVQRVKSVINKNGFFT